jgi:hypothetical protein
LKDALSEDMTRVSEYKAKPETIENPSDLLRIRRSVYYTHAGLVRTMLQSELGPKYWEYRSEESINPFATIDIDEN